MISLDKKSDCCGCSACFSICHHNATTLEKDEEGFCYPQFNKEKCIECGLCNIVCPIIHYKSEPKTGNPLIYAAININQTQYLQSSSGGMFILLCEYIISKKGIVCGAIYDKNFNVKHAFAKTLEECKAFQGSKYVQSDIKGIYPQIKSILKEGTYVLFSGTPCQVAGLKLYLHKDYENLFTTDLICHGVPSPLIFQKYLDFIKGNNEITSINMKSKLESKGTAIKIDFSNGKYIRQTLKTDLWNKLYFGHLIIRPSCYDCQFTHYNRTGDITIGDYWQAHKYYPDFHQGKMISLMLINSSKGTTLFNNIKNKLDYIPINKKESQQAQLQHPYAVPPIREQFWNEYEQYGFHYIAKKYLKFTTYMRFKSSIHSLLKKINKLYFYFL